MKLLYCYPYYGELGWTVFNWTPHIAWVHQEYGPFDGGLAWIRSGHEGLYRHIKTFYVTDEHEGYTEGNAFVLHRQEAYATYHRHCALAAQHITRLRHEGHEVVAARLPSKFYRYHRYKKQRAFHPLKAQSKQIVKWSSCIDSEAVIFHLRAIDRSTKKNTPVRLYRAAAGWARKNGRPFVTVGRTGDYNPGFKIEGLDLLNQTDLSDLIAILGLGGLVVGSSSGPMHMAAAVGTPHVVWGGGRSEVRARYLKTWNPFDVPVDHLTTAFNFSDNSMLTAAMTKMAKRTKSQIKRRIDDVAATV